MDPDDQKGRHSDHGQGSRGKEKGPASMAARIGASASGLLRDGLLQPSANALASTLASSTANKGESFSSTSGSSDSALPFCSRAPDGLSNNSAGQSTQSESFRTGPWSNSNLVLSSQQDIDGFISTSNTQLPVSDDQLAYRNGAVWPTEEYSKFPDQPTRPSTPNVVGTLDRKSGGDGDAVVALLSDPDFFVDDAPTNNFTTSDENISAADLFTDTQFGVQDVQRYKSQLPAPPKHCVPSPTNPLNLIPDFASRETNGVDGATMPISAVAQSGEGSYTYHVTQPQSTQDYLEPWMEVLTEYQDEVWGDMLPLVQQARDEIKEAQSGANGALHDHPAVQRLRMVLGHLESSGMSSQTYNGSGYKPYQADGRLTGSLNHQSQPNIMISAGEQSLSAESVMQEQVGIGLQQNSKNQMDSQSTSVRGSGQFNQAMWGKEMQIDKVRAERRALVEFEQVAAIRKVEDRQYNTFRRERRSSQDSTAAEHPEDPISDLEEEDHFVWYHRLDLGISWAEVKQAYDDHFPERDQEDFRNRKYNYYRCLDACGQTETKQSEQVTSLEEEYGMRARTGLWYPWMKGHWL